MKEAGKLFFYSLNAEMINLRGEVSYNTFMSAIDGKMIGQGEITGWFVELAEELYLRNTLSVLD